MKYIQIILTDRESKKLERIKHKFGINSKRDAIRRLIRDYNLNNEK